MWEGKRGSKRESERAREREIQRARMALSTFVSLVPSCPRQTLERGGKILSIMRRPAQMPFRSLTEQNSHIASSQNANDDLEKYSRGLE